MVDKKTVAILVILVFYIFFVKPKSQIIESVMNELLFYQKKIVKEQYIKENKGKVIKEINEMLKVDKENEKKLFSSDTPNSEAFGKIEDMLKSLAGELELEFVNSYWGEPIVDEEHGYVKLPITASVRGMPEKIDEYLRKVLNWDKLLKIDRMILGTYQRQKVHLSITVNGYKKIKKE